MYSMLGKPYKSEKGLCDSLLITANGDNTACTRSSAVTQRPRDSVSYSVWHAVDSEVSGGQRHTL